MSATIEVVDLRKPCCARLGHGSWCVAADGHAGDHVPGAPATYGPIEARPEIWRRHKGQTEP